MSAIATGPTVADAVAALGIAEPEGQELIFARFGANGGARHYTLRELADADLGTQENLYLASGLFRAGSVRGQGRTRENLSAILWLPFDADLSDWLACPRADLHGLDDATLDRYLAGQREDLERVFAELNLPIHRLDVSGYGHAAYIQVAPELSGSIGLLQSLHKGLIRKINQTWGGKLVDTQASDAGTRVTRLPGTLNTKNTKGAIPRRARTLYQRPGALDAAQAQALARSFSPEPAPEQAARPARPDGVGIDGATADAVVAVMQREWTSGARHALALGLAGMLAKAGASEEQALAVVGALAADDEEAGDRLRGVRDTYEKHRAGLDVAGYTRLREAGVSEDALRRLDELLSPPQPTLARLPSRNVASSAHASLAGAALPPAPAFPAHVLPPAVRVYAEAGARSIGATVPVEMVAVPLLGIVGALIGKRLHLKVKSSWSAYPTLFLPVVAPPAMAKSPALAKARWPLEALQKQAKAEYDQALADWKAKMRQYEKTPPGERGEEPEKPTLREYYTTDTTVEALARLLQDNPGVAIVLDELRGWVSAMNQYKGGKGADRQKYLELWSTAALKVNRVAGGLIYCPTPVGCVVGGIQPDFAGELRTAGGRDGFVERLLPVVLDGTADDWTDDEIAPAQYAALLDLFRALDTLPPADHGIEGRPPGVTVEMTTEARALWIDWFNQNKAVVRAASGEAAGFHQKLDVHVARLALILHALWNPDNPRAMLAPETMERAIELGEFFRRHIARFLALLGTAAPAADAGLAARIIRILRTAQIEGDGTASRTDFLRGLRNVNAADLSRALDGLLAADRVERVEVATATKPAERWRLRPAPNSKYSHYSNFSPPAPAPPPENANSANPANGRAAEPDAPLLDDRARFVRIGGPGAASAQPERERWYA